MADNQENSFNKRPGTASLNGQRFSNLGMRILILNPNITTGGAQRAVLNLAYYLDKFGHEVWLYTTLLQRKGLPKKFKSLNLIVTRHKILKKGGRTSQYQNIDNLFLLLIRLLKIRLELIKIITQEKIEVIIAHQQPFNWVLAFYSRCLVIWNCFEPISLWQSKNENYFPLRVGEPNFFQKILEKEYEWIDKIIIRYGIKHIFVLSKRTQKQIFNLYRKKATVFYAGVDPELLSQKINFDLLKKYKLSPIFNILQVGQFNEEKNQLLTIDVFKKIKEKIPKAKLILIGDGPLRKEIEEKIETFKLKEDVILTGRLQPINNPLLVAFLKRANVLVYPSSIQSWGLVPFEALAFGTIPLVSKNCGATEVIQKENIGLIMELDFADYFQKLIYIFSHPNKIKKMAERGMRYTRHHLNLELYAKRIEEKIWKLR